MPEENVGENGHQGRPSDGGRGDAESRRPFKQSRRGSRGPRPSAGGSRPGAIGLRRIGGDDFELVHPRAVRETELDYEEGIELWKAGDPESARDALRYALSACRDNIWVHVALGQIALAEFRDPALARGHFGYAFDLAHRALPRGFVGRLPRHRPDNRPFYEAMSGLAEALAALGRHGDSTSLKALASQLSGKPVGE
jgi:tetratricopeptide (TPR) repeat protein